MSANGVDAGSSDQKSDLNGYLPIDVEVTRASSAEPAATSGFAVAKIARRIPTAVTVKDPLVRGTSVPEFRESYREMRFGLEQLRERAGVRTIGVVSVHDGEGKSVTATNLALTLTEGGRRRVALIDASFYNPKIARLLDADAPIGLAEVLAGKVQAERAMFSAENGLYAMSAGNLSNSGVDPLDVAEAFGNLVNRLATVFDYVIVDTPSLDKQVEAAAFCGRLDGVVLVVRAGKTKLPEVDKAIARLGENRVLGLVLNQTR